MRCKWPGSKGLKGMALGSVWAACVAPPSTWITGRFSHFEWLKTLSPKTAPPWIVSQNSAQETEPLPSSVAISDDTSLQRFAHRSYVARQHRSAEKWHPALQVIDLASGTIVDIGDVNTWKLQPIYLLFFGGWTLQKVAFSNQNKGHLMGSRYIIHPTHHWPLVQQHLAPGSKRRMMLSNLKGLARVPISLLWTFWTCLASVAFWCWTFLQANKAHHHSLAHYFSVTVGPFHRPKVQYQQGPHSCRDNCPLPSASSLPLQKAEVVFQWLHCRLQSCLSRSLQEGQLDYTVAKDLYTKIKNCHHNETMSPLCVWTDQILIGGNSQRHRIWHANMKQSESNSDKFCKWSRLKE